MIRYGVYRCEPVGDCRYRWGLSVQRGASVHHTDLGAWADVQAACVAATRLLGFDVPWTVFEPVHTAPYATHQERGPNLTDP